MPHPAQLVEHQDGLDAGKVGSFQDFLVGDVVPPFNAHDVKIGIAGESAPTTRSAFCKEPKPLIHTGG